jgi:hypothetical protein
MIESPAEMEPILNKAVDLSSAMMEEEIHVESIGESQLGRLPNGQTNGVREFPNKLSAAHKCTRSGM